MDMDGRLCAKNIWCWESEDIRGNAFYEWKRHLADLAVFSKAFSVILSSKAFHKWEQRQIQIWSNKKKAADICWLDFFGKQSRNELPLT